MSETKKFVPRVVNVNDERISINHPDDESLPIVQKINNVTWDYRFEKICSKEGYNTGRKLIKKRSMNDWVAVHHVEKNPVALFIEGNAFYNGINRQNLFVDFSKLRFSPLFRQPINYFAVHSNDKASYNLHTILRRENYNLETKMFDPKGYNYQNSIMPKFTTKLISLMYDSPPPDIEHVVIVSKDWYLIDPIQYLRNTLNIKVTLAISKVQTMSNYFLSQFDDFIDLTEMCDYTGSLSARHEPVEKE